MACRALNKGDAKADSFDYWVTLAVVGGHGTGSPGVSQGIGVPHFGPRAAR